MAREKPGDGFDWVTARQTCNAQTKFAALIDAVKADVAKVDPHGEKFRAQHDQPDHFAVFRAVTPATARQRYFVVRFLLRGNDITITAEKQLGPEFELVAAVKLSSAGECVFVVDQEELASWELPQRVLETLLFG